MKLEKQVAELYKDAELYDIQSMSQQDLHFWGSLVKSYSISSFLEICCGTGRIGVIVINFLDLYHGVDLSASFLEKFRKKVHQPHAKFELYQARMQDFDTGRNYDAVAIPFNSFSHLYTFEDIDKTLKNVAKHMKEEAIFVFDIHNPSLEILLREPHKEIPIGKFTYPSLGIKVILYESNRYDRASQINNISWRYVTEEGEEIKRLFLPMRIFFPAEMDNILITHGFKTVHKYGTFYRKLFNSESPKQIYICRKG